MTTTTSSLGSPTSWQVREKHGPSQREGARAYSQTAADERSNIKQSHKVYIDRTLAFSGAKTMSAGITTWWISDVRGSLSCKDDSFAQGRKKHSSILLITPGLNMVFYICRLSGT